jgi:hypothetical protein
MLKQAMRMTPVLSMLDFTKFFWIETNAYASGIAVILVQEGHHVAYYSKALDINNKKLAIYAKEFLAILMIGGGLICLDVPL